MNSDERTVSAIFARDRAGRRLRNATVGAGIVGVTVAGVVMVELPAAAHSTSTGSSSQASSGKSAGSGSASTGSGSSSNSGSSSSNGSFGSSSAPSSSSGPAGATSGGS